MEKIALYSGKISQMPGLIQNVKTAVNNLKSELSELQKKANKVDSSVCDLSEVISSIRSSTQIQEERVTKLENFHTNSEDFITDAVRIDDSAAETVNQEKKNFYEKYSYLKPDCEKEDEGLLQKIGKWFKKAGEWCKGHWKQIAKIAAAVIIVAALAVATVLTGGAAGGVAGFILAGALKGAIIGGLSSAVIGVATSAISHRLKNGSWEGVGEAIFSGASDGLLSGVIIGGAAGAAGNAIKVIQAGKMWNPGTFKSGYQSMKYHYGKHAIEEGFSKGNNIVKYTKDAIDFSNRNASLLKYTFDYKHGNVVWKMIFNNTRFVPGQGGTFDSLGRIIQFWYMNF